MAIQTHERRSKRSEGKEGIRKVLFKSNYTSGSFPTGTSPRESAINTYIRGLPLNAGKNNVPPVVRVGDVCQIFNPSTKEFSKEFEISRIQNQGSDAFAVGFIAFPSTLP